MTVRINCLRESSESIFAVGHNNDNDKTVLNYLVTSQEREEFEKANYYHSMHSYNSQRVTISRVHIINIASNMSNLLLYRAGQLSRQQADTTE